MPSKTAINYNNACSPIIQQNFPEFYEIIRNHRAFILHAEFDYSLTRFYSDADRERRSTDTILKEYEKEKKKLMKLLRPYKNICCQPGSVIDQVMRQECHRLRNDVYPSMIV